MPKTTLYTQSSFVGTVRRVKCNMDAGASVSAEVTTKKREFIFNQDIIYNRELHFDIIQKIEVDQPPQTRISRTN